MALFAASLSKIEAAKRYLAILSSYRIYQMEAIWVVIYAGQPRYTPTSLMIASTIIKTVNKHIGGTYMWLFSGIR